MLRNIIIGNGVNIKFDQNMERWRKFVIDCQTEFLVLLNDCEISENEIIYSIFSVWEKIKKYINFNQEENSLEEIVRFFDIQYYEKYMSKYEYKFFVEEIWGKTMGPHIPKDGRTYEISEDGKLFLEANLNLFFIKEMYKKAISNVLFNDYEINDIKVPSAFIQCLNNEYSKVFTLNYDHNLEGVEGIKYLHGKYKEENLKLLGQKPVRKKDIEAVQFLKEKLIDWNMILESRSGVKEKQTIISNSFSGEEPTQIFRSLEINGMDGVSGEVNSVVDYDELKKLSGMVEIIGVSQKNDEKILEYVLSNEKVSKVILYCDLKEKISHHPKLEVIHYNAFWTRLKL